LHRLRSAAVKARTALVNQLRGLLAEFGISVLQGLPQLRRRALPDVLTRQTTYRRCCVRSCTFSVSGCVRLDTEVARLTNRIEQLANADERCQALMQRRGVGPLIASAFTAELCDPHAFHNGRQVAAWLGLVPRQHSSGGQPMLLGVSKRGDAYLRTLLIHCARAAIRTATRHTDAVSTWAISVQARGDIHKATVALANKMARQLWAQLAYG